MEPTGLLIDTSIIIDHLRKQNKQATILYNIVDQYTLYISTVVEFELFVGATDSQKRYDIQTILQLCTSLPLTSDVAQQAAGIYQLLRVQNQLVEIRDMFIAATAIVFDLPLLTLNTRHFARIQSLRLHPLP